jgi:hypothetical protein
MPGGSPDPDPSPNLSKEEIATEVMNRMRTEFGGNIRQGLQDKARDGARVALSDLGVLTVNNVAGVLYRFFMDRVYQTFSDNVPGFWPWLRNKVGTGNGPVIPDEAVKP